MTGARRAWWVFGIVAWTTQDSRPDWDAVRAQLRSGDPVQVAWGARRAADQRLPQAGPELMRVLERMRGRAEDGPALALFLTVLDAATCCGARLPPELLVPWADHTECAIPLLAYAARQPGACAPVTTTVLRRTQDHLTWCAAANLLFAADPHTLVPTLLADAAVRFEILVGAPDPTTRTGSISFAKDRAPSWPDGFPPALRYRLFPDGFAMNGKTAPADRTFLDGPERLWIVRVEDSGPAFLLGLSPDRADYAVQYLDRLVPGTPGAHTLRRRSPLVHAWRGAAAWESEVAVPVRAARARWSVVVDGLLARRLIDRDVAADLRQRFEVEIDDRRADRSQALPELR